MFLIITGIFDVVLLLIILVIYDQMRSLVEQMEDVLLDYQMELVNQKNID